MEVHRWSSVVKWPENIGLIIGNFDGVHRGHQQMLSNLIAACQNKNLIPTAMSFYPHPRSVVLGKTPEVISTIRDRAFWLEHYGLKQWILMPFTPRFMHISPQTFVQNFLLDNLHVRHLLVGDDFRFGYKGIGNFRLLKNLSDGNYSLDNIATVAEDGRRISSTSIRQAILQGHIDQARMLLGHELTLTGIVHHGDGRGRLLDARTVNLHASNTWCLPDGVYVVQLRVLYPQSEWMWGVANLGNNPTFNGLRRKLEVHVMSDNCPMLYEKTVQVSISHYLRREIRFDSAEALKKQIQQDITAASDFIASANQIRH